jgi:chromosome partitioning protein
MAKTEIITIINQKGGVGKTTTTVNLAAGLVLSGKKVLVIDTDPQGHSSEHLACKNSGDSQSNLLSVLRDKKPIKESMVQTYQKNLFCLTSNLSLGQFNQSSPTQNQFILRDALKDFTSKDFDFVLIDCQPSLSLLTLNALTASTSVILPVQAEFLALDGLTQLIYTLKEVREKLHPKLYILGILLTMYDSRNKLSSEVLTELQNNFQKEIFETVIPRNVALAEAPSFGKTIFDYNPSSTGAKAYKDLTKEVLKRLN